MEDWTSTIQSWGGKLLDAGIQSRVSQPYELNKLRLEALGQNGYYTEGTAGALKRPGTIAGMPSSTVLLLGGAVLLFVLMKD